MEINITSLLKFYTLILLKDKTQHGYELMKGLETMTGKSVSPNQVYPFLTQLRKNKLIQIKTTGEREKKQYCLTKKGQEFVNSLLSRCENIIGIAVQSHLTACHHCSCQIYERGHKEKISRKELVFCCSHCADHYKKSK